MDIEAGLLKILSQDELELLTKEKIKSFHGLLTREVALRLIAKEKGLLREERKECGIAEIPKGGKGISFQGSIRKIWPPAAYSSGKRSRVIEIADETGSATLVLWNEDTKIGDRLRLNDRVRVGNAYERGGEMHLGYSGTLEVTVKAGFSSLASLEEGMSAHVKGVVSAIEGTDTFIRGKAPAWGFAFMISDGESARRCVITGGLDRSQGIRRGDEIRIESATLDNGNLFLDAGSRIMVRRPESTVRGKVERLVSEGETLRMTVDGHEHVLPREGALQALGVRAAPDILLSTVVALKKDKLLNSMIAFKIQEGPRG